MTDPTDAMHKQARAQTDPLFFQDYFMAAGHDVGTKNATATFILFEGDVYVLTCRHVVEILQNRQENKHSPFPTLALMVNRGLLNLAFFSAVGLQNAIKLPNTPTEEQELDLAVAKLPKSYWDILTSKKNKKPIDMDNWHEPRWARAEMLVAAGYPDEHKTVIDTNEGEKVGAPMLLVSAEIDGKIAKDERLVTMRSRLETPHGYYFSGMSGGPIYVQQDELLVPVGITYLGWPQTHDKPVIFSDTGTDVLFDSRDIIVYGLTLTPDNFSKWLKASGLKH